MTHVNFLRLGNGMKTGAMRMGKWESSKRQEKDVLSG